MMRSYTKLDYVILKSVIRSNDNTKGVTRANGTTIKEIINITKLSEGKVRTTIARFVEDGFLCFGISEGRTKKYCITEAGIKELEDIYNYNFEEDLD